MTGFVKKGLWLAAALVPAILGQPLIADQASQAPAAKVIQLDPAATEYMPVLSGPPETITMRSGSVVLLPSKDVGKHSTGNNEEALVVLAGSGEMRMSSGVILKLKPYVVAYCPPETEHNVVNTGSDPLRPVSASQRPGDGTREGAKTPNKGMMLTSVERIGRSRL